MAKTLHRFTVAFFSLTIFVFLFFSSSCKKRKAVDEEDAQITVDVRYTQSECDEVVRIINAIILEQQVLRGKTTDVAETTSFSICGVTVDSSKYKDGIFTINFTNALCGSHRRSGTVKVSIEGYPLKKWKHQLCVMRIEYLGYTSTRNSDGRSVRLDGMHLLTNESGGSLYELFYLNEPKVVYKMTGEGLKATFDGKDYCEFNFNRRLNFTHENSVLTCSVDGLGSFDGRNGLENWGTNRAGRMFSTKITTPYVWTSTCGALALLSGEVIIAVENKAHLLTCTYSVKKDGSNYTGDSGLCPYGWRVNWNFKNKSSSRVFGF